MSDDIFSQLINLFNEPGPINWKLATEAAKQITGNPEPVDPWIAEEYQELARLAQLQTQAATPLPSGGLDAQPVDRRTWATEIMERYAYLVEPMTDKFEGSSSDPMSMMMSTMGPALLGLQIGTTVGFWAHRALGQFDIGLPASVGERASTGTLYLVRNVEDFASDYELEPRQVRLWVALRETLYESMTQQSLVRNYLENEFANYLGSLSVNLGQMQEKMQGIMDPSQFEQLIGGDEAPSLFGSDPEGANKLRAFMGFIDGYGAFFVEQAVRNLLPDLTAINAAWDLRRSEPRHGEQLITRGLALELTDDLVRDGRNFCREASQRWGIESLDKIWHDLDLLPTREELADPIGWAARTQLPEL